MWAHHPTSSLLPLPSEPPTAPPTLTPCPTPPPARYDAVAAKRGAEDEDGEGPSSHSHRHEEDEFYQEAQVRFKGFGVLPALA